MPPAVDATNSLGASLIGSGLIGIFFVQVFATIRTMIKEKKQNGNKGVNDVYNCLHDHDLWERQFLEQERNISLRAMQSFTETLGRVEVTLGKILGKD